MGQPRMRVYLNTAAIVLLHPTRRWSRFESQEVQLTRRVGYEKAHTCTSPQTRCHPAL